MNAIELITKRIMEDTDCKEKQSQYLEDIYCNSNNKSEIDELIVTNSIPLNKDANKCNKIRVISIANIIAECITRLSNEESLSEMFL